MTVGFQALPVCGCGSFSVSVCNPRVRTWLGERFLFSLMIGCLWFWMRLAKVSLLLISLAVYDSGCKECSDGLLDIKQLEPNIWLHKERMNHEHMDYISVQIHRDCEWWEMDSGLYKLALGWGHGWSHWTDKSIYYVLWAPQNISP